MIIRNEDVGELVAEIPEGHRHLRTTIVLRDGTSVTLQEATVAAIVRAYVAVRTHPVQRGVVMRSERLEERKEGYAEWQLLELSAR